MSEDAFNAKGRTDRGRTRPALPEAEANAPRSVGLGKCPGIVLLLLCLLLPAGASQFRSVKSIRTPTEILAGATAVASFQPVDQAVVEEAIRGLIKSWNGPGFEAWIGDSFYRRERLLDAIDQRIPRDAQLRLLAIQGIQTLEQYTEPEATGWPLSTLVSIVSATVRTQIEFNDPEQGFRRLEGVNEFIFRVTERKRMRSEERQ